MRTILLTAFVIGLSMLMSSVGLAAIYNLELELAEPGPDANSLHCGDTVRIHITVENTFASNVLFLENAFRIYSPDWATIPPLAGNWNPDVPWVPTYFNTVGAEQLGSPQKIYFGAAVLSAPGLPPAFRERMGTISAVLSCDDVGLTVCIDSVTMATTTPTWTWTLMSGNITPSWGGERCFTIAERRVCIAAGDVNSDGIALSLADLEAFEEWYVDETGPMPDSLFQCDLTGDCYINWEDIEVYRNYFDVGLSAFDPYGGYPVQTCCEPTVLCCGRKVQGATGDVNNDGVIDLGDLLGIANAVFLGGSWYGLCYAAGNADGDVACVVDIGDLLAIASSVFLGSGQGTAPCDPACEE